MQPLKINYLSTIKYVYEKLIFPSSFYSNTIYMFHTILQILIQYVYSIIYLSRETINMNINLLK